MNFYYSSCGFTKFNKSNALIYQLWSHDIVIMKKIAKIAENIPENGIRRMIRHILSACL